MSETQKATFFRKAVMEGGAVGTVRHMFSPQNIKFITEFFFPIPGKLLLEASVDVHGINAKLRNLVMEAKAGIVSSNYINLVHPDHWNPIFFYRR